MLFSGASYYAEGGMGDFVNDYDTWQAAVMESRSCNADWWHVFDTVTMKFLPHVKLGNYSGQYIPNLLKP